VSQPLLLHIFPSFSVGGAQVRFSKLANHFGSRWRHAVVALDGRIECIERIGKHVDLDVIPAPASAGQGLPQRLLSIWRLLERLQPDALITSNWGSIEWAMARLAMPSIPHLHTEDGFGPEESSGQLRRRVLTRRVALRRSTVILPSQTLLQSALKIWKLSKNRVHYIPNGLDLQHFHPMTSTDSAAPGTPVIGTIAALRAEKNLARLLRAAALLRQQGFAFRLNILGDGPERPTLEALSRSLNLDQVTSFIGHVPDPSAHYHSFDVFALSSDTEQMPFSILEAMAAGLPIASTDAGDIRIIISPENAPYVVRQDDAALADAIRLLLKDPSQRSRLGLANRAKAERDYDQEVMFHSHAQLIDRALMQRKAHRSY
jgi:glycosyltransferase involved in cell wall biosynthesis